MNQELKCNPKLSNVDAEWFRVKIENGVRLYKNYHRLFHEKEEVQINGKTIFVTTKNSSYQIKKNVDGNKINYKIKY